MTGTVPSDRRMSGPGIKWPESGIRERKGVFPHRMGGGEGRKATEWETKQTRPI